MLIWNAHSLLQIFESKQAPDGSRFQELVAGNLSDSLFIVMLSEREGKSPCCSQLPTVFTSGDAHLWLSHIVMQYWSQFRESFSSVAKKPSQPSKMDASKCTPLTVTQDIAAFSLLSISVGSLTHFPAVLVQRVDFHNQLRPQQVGS